MTGYIGERYPKLREPFHYIYDDDLIKIYYNDSVVGIYTYYCSPQEIEEDIELFSKKNIK